MVVPDRGLGRGHWRHLNARSRGIQLEDQQMGPGAHVEMYVVEICIVGGCSVWVENLLEGEPGTE